jgi:hypothetical protein
MTPYDISASVSSPPTNVSLKIDGKLIDLARDATGAWTGKAQLELPDPAQVDFRAVGVPEAKWTLEIKFTPKTPPGADAIDYKHDDKIPPEMLSIFSAPVSPTKETHK